MSRNFNYKKVPKQAQNKHSKAKLTSMLNSSSVFTFHNDPHMKQHYNFHQINEMKKMNR